MGGVRGGATEQGMDDVLQRTLRVDNVRRLGLCIGVQEQERAHMLHPQPSSHQLVIGVPNNTTTAADESAPLV